LLEFLLALPVIALAIGRTLIPMEFGPELDLFRGEVLGLDGVADFYAKNLKELRAEFKKSLRVFLAACQEKGIEPRRQFSGRFNLRISPQLHEMLAIAAQAQGKSINTLAQEALQERVMP
jgi:predicted HicB family RNase H-like nuclease